MSFLRFLLQRWLKLHRAARDGLLGDPNVVLFERRSSDDGQKRIKLPG